MLLPLLLLLGSSAPSTPTPPDAQAMFTLPDLQALSMRLHERMDLNHDTFVTLDELMKGARAMAGTPEAPPQPVPPLVQTLFDEGDANRDGRISVEENLAGVDRQFKIDDANHDGVVTRGEYMAVVALSAQRLIDAAGASRKVPSE